MKFYQEIKLISQNHVSKHIVLEKVFSVLHLSFCNLKKISNIQPCGLSFPEYVSNDDRITVGNIVRIFAESENDLESLKLTEGLARKKEYIYVSNVRPIAMKIKGYAIFQRKQIKTSVDRQVRRFAVRHKMSHNESLDRYQGMRISLINDLPYIHLKSNSNRERFRLFIEKKSVNYDSNKYDFNTYGLSSNSTVPEF